MVYYHYQSGNAQRSNFGHNLERNNHSNGNDNVFYCFKYQKIQEKTGVIFIPND